ncbi:MAG: hypothetical protein ABF247_00815 [Nonlabens sp.]|uniref:hypothetical protein n=1 Tax=Nonlabens sp. TaxID=1888209 RepID=UPI00321AFB24
MDFLKLSVFLFILSQPAYAQFALNNLDLKLKNPPTGNYTITQKEDGEIKKIVQFNDDGKIIFEYRETEIPTIFQWKEPHRFIYAFEYDSNGRIIKKYDFNSNAGLSIYTYEYGMNPSKKTSFEQKYIDKEEVAKNSNAYAFISKFKNFKQLKDSELVATINQSSKEKGFTEKLNSNGLPIEREEYSDIYKDTIVTSIQYHLNGKELFRRVISKNSGEVRKEIMVQYRANSEFKDITNFKNGNQSTSYKFAKALNAKSKSFVEYAENKGFLTIRSYIYKDDYLDRVSVFQSKFEGELIVPITKRTMKTAEISYKYNDDGLLEKETMRNYRNGKKESRKYKYNIETSN